jgi:hypothetical protein
MERKKRSMSKRLEIGSVSLSSDQAAVQSKAGVGDAITGSFMSAVENATRLVM